ncbi:MAG: hypothetical protein NC432_10715 [Roseburia sp.]|nr:hypothetical protein [Roseburia sp.]MCM1099245.1 hypothetical protein [Ruminococcus flavefaciens]
MIAEKEFLQHVESLLDFCKYPAVHYKVRFFRYFSCNRHYSHNRVVDCTVEVLDFLKQYRINNTGR